VAGPEVRRAELDGARDQPVGADDRRHPLLHEAVAQGHEHVDQIAVVQRRQHVGDVGRLEGDEPEVERPGQLVDRAVRVERDDALLAEDIDPQPRPTQPLHVLGVGIERHDPGDALRHQSRRDPAYSARPDDEDAGVDHVGGSPPSKDGGGRRSSSPLREA